MWNPHGQDGSLSSTGHSQTLAAFIGGPALGLKPWGSWGRFVVYKGGEIQFWRCQRCSFECLDDAGWVPWDPMGSTKGSHGWLVNLQSWDLPRISQGVDKPTPGHWVPGFIVGSFAYDLHGERWFLDRTSWVFKPTPRSYRGPKGFYEVGLWL